MTEVMLLHVPLIYREGYDAAVYGTRMSAVGVPLGFTFCPYRDGSVERWNFIGGCVEAYMGQDAPIRGEQ